MQSVVASLFHGIISVYASLAVSTVKAHFLFPRIKVSVYNTKFEYILLRNIYYFVLRLCDHDADFD